VRRIFGKPQWEKSKVLFVYQVKLLKNPMGKIRRNLVTNVVRPFEISSKP
jgi:hypothetical protein